MWKGNLFLFIVFSSFKFSFIKSYRYVAWDKPVSPIALFHSVFPMYEFAVLFSRSIGPSDMSVVTFAHVASLLVQL